jgi:hypothetical protein
MVNSESLQFFAKVNFLTKKPNLSFNSRLKEFLKIHHFGQYEREAIGL